MCPSDSSRISPSEALQQLRAWRLPSLGTACEELLARREQIQFLYLYQHYFPEAYASSTASCTCPLQANLGPHASEAGATQTYSSREREFLTLVDQHLFPLDLDYLDAFEGEASGALFPMVVNPSYCDVELDDLCLPVRVLFALVAVNDIEVWTELCAQIGHRAPLPATTSGRKIDWDRFADLCSKHGGAMADVPPALDVLAHATGNFWLDLDENTLGYEWFEWDVPSLDYLAREWKHAQPLLKKYNAVLDWLEAQPRRLATIIRLWNRTAVRRDARPE